ncbi:MAG: pyridoxamine 5'-phosphate oxidase family protein [Actinomycetota bacterium]|nr:pyridoxamine 5'-phosphate oxidase family protein [Actinomycetota bacterium]
MTQHSDVNVDWSGQEVLSPEECWRLLAAAPVGRVGFFDEGSPVILPVNFAVDGHSIAFRSAAGSKLDAAVMNRPVCFEIDQWDAMAHTGWSVLAKGTADHVLDEEGLASMERLPVVPWSRPDLRIEWIRMTVQELSGRRIAPI